MKLITTFALTLLIGCMSAASLRAQDTKKAAIAALVNTQNYVFIAQSAMPMSGGTKLT